jgi:polyribonucleotide nucleotidyltransferase
MDSYKISRELFDKNLTIEIGRVAKITNGSCLITYGESLILVTAVMNDTIKEGIDFFPLTVDYIERTSAAGKIPGGFFKREGRPSEREVLSSRLIDRPIRPLFPSDFKNEVQIIATVLSMDPSCDPDVIAITGASCALSISDIPFNGPVAACRIARINGNFIFNPSIEDLPKSDLNIVVASTKKGVVMVEGGGREISEQDMLAAIDFAYTNVQPILDLQEELAQKCGKEKHAYTAISISEDLTKKIKELSYDKLKELNTIKEKQKRSKSKKELKNALVNKLESELDAKELTQISDVLSHLDEEIIRNKITNEKIRIDGRSFDDIRQITCEIGLLPRTHGSSLFTRGETQALVVTTLGTSEDKQIIDDISGEYFKRFMLHYNFPPFSTGEVKPLRGPGRREIGHGALAERALSYVLPSADDFPYTIRIVSEILQSNGSSSMATVCGASLSLMDAGVPIKSHVAGIAMGLIKEDDSIIILNDILGDEDHIGDMDFKVAGTRGGITAIQMDIKIENLTIDIMKDALAKAKISRLKILDLMESAILNPRKDISIHAPRIVTIQVKLEKIKDVIGPGGKNIKQIIEKTGVKIDIENGSGKVAIATNDKEACDKAIEMIRRLTEEPEEGKIYMGTVKKIMDFGAFVEILPGVEGLVHISQLDKNRVKNVEDIVREGDKIAVKVLEIDRSGKIKLSRKDAIKQ